MLSTLQDHGIPQKVLRKAQQLGVHNDCLVAGVGRTCKACAEGINMAFDFYYGHCETSVEVIGEIINDLMAEQDQE